MTAGSVLACCAVLTRPEGRNDSLAERLAAAGVPSLCIPALEIELLPGVSAPGPENFDLAVFVSGQAVQAYMQAWHRAPGTHWPTQTLAASVGQATAQVLLGCKPAGPAQVIYPDAGSGNDSEALWRVLQPRLRSVRSALLVRGLGGRDWLAAQLQAAGVQVQRVELYRRKPAVLSAAQRAAYARELHRGAPAPVILLTSAQGLAAMVDQMQQAGLLAAWLNARFLAVHPRIAAQLLSVYRGAGMTGAPMVKLCSPNDDAIFQAIVAMASFPERS